MELVKKQVWYHVERWVNNNVYDHAVYRVRNRVRKRVNNCIYNYVQSRVLNHVQSRIKEIK